MLTFIVYVLACAGAHRIWNFEAVFQAPRSWLLRYWWAKPVTCQACNALWISAALAFLVRFIDTPNGALCFHALAAYAVVRGLLWVYKMASHWEVSARKSAGFATPVISNGGNAVPRALVQLQPPPEGCRDCETKKAAIIAAQATARTSSRRVVLLTVLSNFSPGYSLTSVICDQARMLAENPDWLVQIWVHEGADLADAPTDFPANVTILRVVPQVAWKADTLDPVAVSLLGTRIRSQLMQLGNATVITHDLLFVSSYTSFAAAIHEIGQTPGFAWLHVAHSAAGARPAQNGAAVQARTNLPPGHKILCLNEALRLGMAQYYAATVKDVRVCPNARDITSFGVFDPRAARLVRDHRLDSAEIVQVFPLSTTRMKEKGVHRVIDIFAALSKSQIVRLVLVTAHANGDKEKNALMALRTYAQAAGLPSECLVITCEDFPDTAAQGLSRNAVRDLFAVSNLFIFPTISEASSLVLTEAALAGCLLVPNASVPALGTIVPHEYAIYCRFGGLLHPEPIPVSSVEVSERIRHALQNSLGNLSKRYVLRHAGFRAVGAILTALVDDLPLRGK